MAESYLELCARRGNPHKGLFLADKAGHGERVRRFLKSRESHPQGPEDCGAADFRRVREDNFFDTLGTPRRVGYLPKKLCGNVQMLRHRISLGFGATQENVRIVIGGMFKERAFSRSQKFLRFKKGFRAFLKQSGGL